MHAILFVSLVSSTKLFLAKVIYVKLEASLLLTLLLCYFNVIIQFYIKLL